MSLLISDPWQRALEIALGEDGEDDGSKDCNPFRTSSDPLPKPCRGSSGRLLLLGRTPKEPPDARLSDLMKRGDRCIPRCLCVLCRGRKWTTFSEAFCIKVRARGGPSLVLKRKWV